jgi:hypothetical protein
MPKINETLEVWCYEKSTSDIYVCYEEKGTGKDDIITVIACRKRK